MKIFLFFLSLLLHSQVLFSMLSPHTTIPPSVQQSSVQRQHTSSSTSSRHNSLSSSGDSGSGDNVLYPITGPLTTPPTPLDSPNVYIINISQVLINWEYTTTVPTQFVVQCLSDYFPDGHNHNITDGLINSTQFIYTKMNLGSFYVFRYIAYQGGVASAPSPGSDVFKNGATAPTGPPVNVQVLDSTLTNTSVTLYWGTPQPPLDTSYIYHIYKGDSPTNLIQVDSITNDQQYNFRHLTPNTTYYFAVQADISGIKSILSNIVNLTTNPLGQLPSIVFNVTPAITTATVTWTPPTISLYNTLQEYKVYYTPQLATPTDISEYKYSTFTSDSKMGVVTGLEEGVVYVFRLQYKMDNVLSPLSSPLSVQMKTSVVCTSCIGLSSSLLQLKLKVQSPQTNNQHFNFSVTSLTCTNRTLITSNSTITLSLSSQPWTHCNYTVSLLTSYFYYGPPAVCPSDKCTTLPDKPSGFPTDLTPGTITSHSIELSWIPLPTHQWNSPTINYIITCTNCQSNNKLISVNYGTQFLLVKGLLPFMTYDFFISAQNEIGFGPSSEILSVTTAQDAPSGPPLNITVNSPNYSSLHITWSLPNLQYRNGIITKYTLYYNSTEYEGVQQASTNATSILLTDLYYGTLYSVWIQAWTAKGSGPNSTIVDYSTLNYTALQIPSISNFTITQSSQTFNKHFNFLLSWSYNYSTATTNLIQANLSYIITATTSNSQYYTNINGLNSTIINSDTLACDTNYTFKIFATFKLPNNSLFTVSTKSTAKTPNCSGVITLMVTIISCVVVSIVILLSLLLTILLFAYKRFKCRQRRRRGGGGGGERSTESGHAIIGSALQPFPPAIPNAYLFDTRPNMNREERGDGESSHSEEEEEIASSFINGSLETVSDQNDESSSYDEDAPLISHHIPTFTSLQQQHGGYVTIDDDHRYHGYVHDDVMATDNMRLVPLGGSSLDSIPESIASAP